MSEHDESGYDPGQDPDTDPRALNPRTGGAAAGDVQGDEDTDAEAANLNPRDDRPGAVG